MQNRIELWLYTLNNGNQGYLLTYNGKIISNAPGLSPMEVHSAPINCGVVPLDVVYYQHRRLLNGRPKVRPLSEESGLVPRVRERLPPDVNPARTEETENFNCRAVPDNPIPTSPDVIRTAGSLKISVFD